MAALGKFQRFYAFYDDLDLLKTLGYIRASELMTQTESLSMVAVSLLILLLCRLNLFVIDPPLPAWESLKHLDEFLARNSDKIADLTESSKPAMDSPLKIFYANCTENPTTAFEAPFTKVYIGTAKEGRTTEELMGLALKVTSDPTALANQKGRVSQPIWGEAVESPGTVLCISGWDSVEAVSNLKALVHSLQFS